MALASFRWPLVALAALCGLTTALACERDRPPGIAPPRQRTDGEGGGGFDSVPGEDCVPEGACGHQVKKVVLNAPNLYFVFDCSGSMADAATPGGVITRYSAVRNATFDMLRSLGALVNVGAALFPGDDQSCDAGGQVLEISPGDPKSGDGFGPTMTSLANVTAGYPSGGTPISSTLEALVAPLSEASGTTVVLLLTDGGPNCNAGITCDASECQPIVEGSCPVGDDCCDSAYPGGGPELCVDRAATVDAVAAIAALGMQVFVIGIPGSEYYSELLDEMALAGGTAQAGDPQYHQVADLTAIGEVFASIAADAISCELPLDDRPSEEDKNFTNVYLDCELLPYDPVNGWGWLEGNTVWLHGEACERLKRGDVAEVHIAIGCPTELPK